MRPAWRAAMLRFRINSRLKPSLWMRKSVNTVPAPAPIAAPASTLPENSFAAIVS